MVSENIILFFNFVFFFNLKSYIYISLFFNLHTDTLRDSNLRRTLDYALTLHRKMSKKRGETSSEHNEANNGGSHNNSSSSNSNVATTASFTQISTVAGRTRSTNRIKPRGNF